MKLNFKYRPNILAGHSIQDFIQYNLYYFIATFLLIGIQKLLLFPFIARKLGPAQFGSFVLFMTIVNIVIVVIPTSVNLVIIRIHSNYDREDTLGIIKSGLLLNIIISVIVCVLFSVIFPYMASIFKINAIYKIFLIPINAYVLFYNLREGLLILQRIDLKFKQIAVFNIIFALLFISIIPMYSLLREKSISFGYFVIGFISLLIVIPSTLKISKGLVKKEFLKQFYIYSPSFAIVSIMELLLIASSRYIISFYRDPTQVAYFFAATSLVQMLIFPFAQIRTILLPFISQKKNLKDFSKKEVRTILLASFGIGVGMFLVGVICGKFIISLLYGYEYYQKSKVVLYIILFGYIFHIFKIYLKNFIIVFFNRSVLVLNVLIMVLINIIINILFVPTYGINASAVGLTLSLIVSSLLWYLKFRNTIYKLAS